MTPFFTAILVIATVSATFSAAAQTASRPPAGLPPIGAGGALIGDQFDKVKAIKKIPVQGLSLVETSDGKTYLISDNGRLAIVGGRWIDLWAGKQVSSIADSTSLDRVDLARMGIKLEEFSVFTIGTGPRQVTAFFDPVCTTCQSLAREMSAASKDYTFNIVLMPLEGTASGQAAGRMHCAPDRSLALTAFMTNKFETLPERTKACDVLPLQKAMIVSRILGVRRTPYFIFANGITADGTDLRLAEVLQRQTTGDKQ